VARAPSPARSVLTADRLHPNTLPDFIQRQSCHPNYLSAAALTGGNTNGRSRHLQKPCEKVNARFIRLTLSRRCGKRQFQRFAHFASDGIPLRPRVNSNRKRNSAGRFFNRNQDHFPRENAVSPSSRNATTGICKCCNVRAFPMLAIRPAAKPSIATLATTLNIFKCRTEASFRIRNRLNIAAKSNASPVPKIQILPV
jgi:hypothetical protein